MTETWLRKENLKSETESRVIEAQNVIKTNSVKAKIDDTQQNSKCSLRVERDKTIYHQNKNVTITTKESVFLNHS